MPVSRLIAAVYVQDPETREDLVLLPGESPPPEIAALITNPNAWDAPSDEGGADTEPESVGAGEQDPSGAEPRSEAGAAGTKKTPQRRSRSSTAS